MAAAGAGTAVTAPFRSVSPLQPVPFWRSPKKGFTAPARGGWLSCGQWHGSPPEVGIPWSLQG